MELIPFLLIFYRKQNIISVEREDNFCLSIRSPCVKASVWKKGGVSAFFNLNLNLFQWKNAETQLNDRIIEYKLSTIFALYAY